ncbi:unnamed protein product [marine sediment metagenome]|uniref:Uncharacterized protein n=1 Tax=marine sediment metagenome TaxID=412755 RepID=X1BE99_9ZZZZ
MKHCPKCNSLLLYLYYRDNRRDERSWVKTKYLYCKRCNKLIDT